MDITTKIKKFLGEDVFSLCKNYNIGNGSCRISCPSSNVIVGDRCPFTKEKQYTCRCYRKS